MRKLVEGIHRFQQETFTRERQLFEALAQGQHPRALFITCSDSRIDPSLLTQTHPGELFIQRTAGNIVPAYGSVLGGEAATIEYAVAALRVRYIIVCGHSLCGAMDGLLRVEELGSMPAVRAYLAHAEATRRIIQENYADVTDPAERLALTVQANVLVQIENLRTHPVVAAAVGRKEIELHGWVYAFESGEVTSYDFEQQEFRPLDEVARPLFEQQEAS